jgi:tetratricopeptide (TPR) repeat protein
VCLACAVAFAQRPNQGEDESAGFVREGRAALRRGELDDAARALDQALVLNPRRVEAYVLRSAVYAARKQYKEGIALMRKAQALSPADAEVLTALGTHLVLSGDTKEGVPLLEQVIAKEPVRYDAQLLLGQHWYGSGKWPDAIRAYEAYFAHRPPALAPEDPRNQVDLADSYLRFRQPKKALPLFEAALRARKHDLRARLGVAWATAAIDCKKARPLLQELEPIAAQHPAIWLVDGQCALTLGDAGGALALGRRYLTRVTKDNAAGHALVGEAHAARGQLAEAKKELETARMLEPERRRWTVRLAFVLRRANQLTDARDVIDAIGPPTHPAIDPDWWVELGELLLATGEAQQVVAKLAPVVPQLPGHALVRTVLGAAYLATGDAEAAIEVLDDAEAVQSIPRSRTLLAEALTTVAAAKLASGDATGAEPMLARAERLDPNPTVLRNLGITKLALDKPAEAVAVLDRAIKLDTGSVTVMLAARAHALSGDFAGARVLYDRALTADTDNVEIAIDWAASEIAGGDPAVAVVALERTATAARTGALAGRHKLALATARHAAGLAQLRAGNGPKAVELLRAAVTGEATLARKCDLAIATVVAGDVPAALAALRAIQGQSCPFPPPSDTQAAPILIAFTEGLSPGKARKALDRLTALSAKSTGTAAKLLGTAIRVVALNAAHDAYHRGQLAQARKHLGTARNASTHVGADELALDLAVLDLADGKHEAAIAQLEKLAAKLPDALVNLGIAYERKGDHARALDAWRRARKAGVRFHQLVEWIEAKERIYSQSEVTP